MTAYYNEFDKYAAKWLRNLIAAGHIAPGIVDDRSIEDVTANDLKGFTQCHFFAGVGVWSLALRRAGWPDDRPVWTASCPCQPFSTAGQSGGFADERHLWPHFQYLAWQRRPPTIFGEQVASKDAEPWIDLVQTDLEALDYSVGAVAFPSAGVGAPHIRDRLYWMAHANGVRRSGRQGVSSGGIHDRSNAGWRQGNHGLVGSNQAGVLSSCRLDHTDHTGLAGHRRSEAESGGTEHGVWLASRPVGAPGGTGGMVHSDGRGCGPGGVLGSVAQVPERGSDQRVEIAQPGSGIERAGPTNGLWRDADWLLCRDGKWRPVEPSTFPLAHGAPARVGRLRAYGNAINAEAARVFIAAGMEAIDET